MLRTDILSINPETVEFIINKAKEFQSKEEVTFDESLTNTEYEYDWSQILADHEDDLTFIEVQNVIEDLDTDQQIDLLTLMYIGRGDFDVNDWSHARQEAKDNLSGNLTNYLLSKPYLADFLEKGLELLGYPSLEEK